MKIDVINSLCEAKKQRQNYDKICLVQSWGREYPFCNYDSLGLGNLITAFIGALIIDENIEIILFNDIRLAPWRWFIKMPLYWYSRSAFSIRNFSNNLKRLRLNAKITTRTFIDTKNRVLYLSTDLVNMDKNYLEGYSRINKEKLELLIFKYYGININPDVCKDSISFKEKILGIHVRMGDFSIDDNIEEAYKPNKRVPMAMYIEALKKILTKKHFSTVYVFSDEPIKKVDQLILGESIDIVDKSVTIEFKYGLNAVNAINEMIACDALLIANSTFSFWAAILGGRENFYLFKKLPYNAQKFIDKFTNIYDLKNV
jgi:hypothetical protein